MATRNLNSRIGPVQLSGLGLTIAAHAMLVALVIASAPTRDAQKDVAALMVRLVNPALPAPPVPKPEPRSSRRPATEPVKKVQASPGPETPILAASAPTANLPAVAVQPDPKPLPAFEARAASPVPPAAPAPVVPPGFNASYLDNPAPVYPPLARRLGEEGRVMLRVHVEASGLPSKVEIRTSSGSERLDQAALETVKRWKFVPARQGDTAVPAFVVVPISFSLKG